MYYPNNPTIIESVDIMRVLTDGTVQDLPDGTQALTVQLVLRPENGKRYAAGSFPLAIHLTDGVQYRTLAFEPDPELPVVSHESSADAQISPDRPDPMLSAPAQTTEDTTSPKRVEPAPVLNEPSTETQ
jgi:hypothetical protein